MDSLKTEPPTLPKTLLVNLTFQTQHNLISNFFHLTTELCFLKIQRKKVQGSKGSKRSHWRDLRGSSCRKVLLGTFPFHFRHSTNISEHLLCLWEDTDQRQKGNIGETKSVKPRGCNTAKLQSKLTSPKQRIHLLF